MSNRTRLYLDVDGVINCFGWHRLWGDMEEGSADADGYSFVIQWAPAMIDALRALDVDLVWTTTWRNNAVKSISPLIGWGGEGRVLHPYMNSQAETSFPSIDWKRETILLDQANSSSPFIHIDDEIDYTPGWPELVQSMGGLAISPTPALGITPKQVSQIQNYLDLVNEKV